MKLMERVRVFIDNQYRTPKGLIGTVIGEKMVKQHKPETLWTIELLNIKQGESVLELGCGAGYAMKLILEQDESNSVIGLDLSPTVIRSAKMRNKKAFIEEKADFIQGNVKSLPFEDGQFDKVFSIHTIYFWDELSTTVSEIYRVLQPGGDFILTLCDGKNDIIWEGIRSMINEQLIPIMKNQGFSGVEVVKGPNSRHYHTIAVAGKK
ncbi:class I SAM-dependent methyltransferase [Mesobacillus thioparans]|uniref:class I SAM-dependent methyltransferase n=1 Tax=Mesobacillus thioparans TaxID=370439 RepID=UPI0039EE445F